MNEQARIAQWFKKKYPDVVAVVLQPDLEQDREGDWFEVWHVFYAAEGCYDVEGLKSYTVHDYHKARNLAMAMAMEKELEFMELY